MNSKLGSYELTPGILYKYLSSLFESSVLDKLVNEDDFYSNTSTKLRYSCFQAKSSATGFTFLSERTQSLRQSFTSMASLMFVAFLVYRQSWDILRIKPFCAVNFSCRFQLRTSLRYFASCFCITARPLSNSQSLKQLKVFLVARPIFEIMTCQFSPTFYNTDNLELYLASTVCFSISPSDELQSSKAPWQQRTLFAYIFN